MLVLYLKKGHGRDYPIPNHRGWPIVGNLFQVRRQRPDITFTEWAKELGPVFSAKVLHRQFTVLNSYDAIHEALVEKGNQFAGRPHKNFSAEIISDGYKSIIQQMPTQTRKNARKVCQKKIKMYDTGLKRIEYISSSMIQNLTEELKKNNIRPLSIQSSSSTIR